MARYTITSLTAELSELLARRYPRIEVQGELSQLSTPASGHAYVTLRDDGATLAGVVWRDAWRGLRWRPKRGDKVVARGRLGIYPSRGSYQLYITSLEPAGQGDLARQIAERKARLEADGLLDPRRKRALPRFPSVIGVATSLTGAALQDFLEVSRARFPAARILVAGCTVQGAAAPASVVQAIELLVDDGRCQVIVVTRGGGSKQDLLAFQDESLARYLAHCPVPVVSAVGHQIDTTLSDLVADVVAPTPSAAAAAVLPDGVAWTQHVDETLLVLSGSMARRIARARQTVQALASRLRHPGERLVAVRRRADDATRRSVVVMQRRLGHERARVRGLSPRLEAAMQRRWGPARSRVEQLEARLQRATQALLAARRAKVERLAAAGVALSPQGVLSRGYAVVVGPKGVLTSAGDVAVGDALKLRLADGSVEAAVTKTL